MIDAAQPTDEVFRFGMLRYDLDFVRQAIAAGLIQTVEREFPIGEWAEQMLGLNRREGWDKAKVLVFGVAIRADHAQALTAERLEEPGIAVINADLKGTLLIDGNHRAGRRYMDGLDTMRFHVIAATDEPKVRLGTPQYTKFRRELFKKRPA